MAKYFYLDESPLYTDKYLIRMNHDMFLFPNGTKGSYNLMAARLLNLSYADYLRYARDRLGAEIIGKNAKYPVAYFTLNTEAQALVKLLNARMDYVMDEQKYPFEYKVNGEGKVERIPFHGEDNEN